MDRTSDTANTSQTSDGRKIRQFQAATNGFTAAGVAGGAIVGSPLEAGARPVLRRGDRGGSVEELQRALTTAGFDPGGVDGIFGGGTETAVRQFQATNALTVDGIVGAQTWAALDRSERTEGDETPPAPPAGERVLDWASVDGGERMRYVMERLVDRYGYPVNGAAGIVGNLWAESGVIPNRIEGSAAGTPMRARDLAGNTVDFTAEQVMNRDPNAGEGPARAGIGLAQWTSAGRRAGLFDHEYEGRRLGPEILSDMHAQVDYLDHELRTSYARVHSVVTGAAVTTDDASDEIVYNFEVPGAILENRKKLPRNDPRVQEVFEARRAHSRRALASIEGS